MNSHQSTDSNNDFRQWYSFSQSSKNNKLASRLKKLLENKVEQKSFSLSKVAEGNEEIFYLKEDYNPTVLKLSMAECSEFLKYVYSFYPTDDLEEDKIIDQHSEYNLAKKIETDHGNELVIGIGEKNKNTLLRLLEKISSRSYLKHSFNFSLLTFLFLQPAILPGNLGYSNLGKFGEYLFYLITFLISFLSVWSYSKLFIKINASKPIFQLTALHNAFFFGLAMAEVAVFDLLEGKFIFLFHLFLIVFGQIAGLLLTIVQSGIIYFVRGGKLIKYQD